MNDNNKGILLLLTKDICKELNCLDKFDDINTIINSRLNNYELTKINDDNQENDIEEKLEMYFQCLRLENKVVWYKSYDYFIINKYLYDNHKNNFTLIQYKN